MKRDELESEDREAPRPKGVSLPAFSERTPDFVHAPTGFRVWLTEPLGILTQVGQQQNLGVEVARFLTGEVTRRLLELHAERPSVGGTNLGLFFMHEWSGLESYTKDTRIEMTRWGLAMRPYAEEIVVHLGGRASALARMGVSVASSALSLAGVRFSMVDDLPTALTARGLRPRGG